MNLYLPHLRTAPGPLLPCNMDLEAHDLFLLIKRHPGQRRGELICHPKLTAAAQYKARLIVERQDLDHNLEMTPNELVRHFEYDLPGWYPDKGNNVESIARGYPTAQRCMDGFLGSEAHRQHILAEHEFYRDQVYIGVAHFLDSRAELTLRNAWCVLTAHRED